jgi:hypothetical protein
MGESDQIHAGKGFIGKIFWNKGLRGWLRAGSIAFLLDEATGLVGLVNTATSILSRLGRIFSGGECGNSFGENGLDEGEKYLLDRWVERRAEC